MRSGIYYTLSPNKSTLASVSPSPLPSLHSPQRCPVSAPTPAPVPTPEPASATVTAAKTAFSTILPSYSSSTSLLLPVVLFSLLLSPAEAVPTPAGDLTYILDYSPSLPEDDPEGISVNRDKAYLPAQIGGIVGAYALSLVLVAAGLLLLSKRRREHLSNGADDQDEEQFTVPTFQFPTVDPQRQEHAQYEQFPIGKDAGARNNYSYPPTIPNFSLPSPTREEYPNPWVEPCSPKSTASACAPGVSVHVDQRVVKQDHKMAQSQLEEMYKHVMEQEDAKQQGITLPAPVPAGSSAPGKQSMDGSQASSSNKKGKNKPAFLNLSKDKEDKAEKGQSRTSSILSALRSPRKKQSMKGMSISSPLMTPMSATFPRQEEGEEMSSIPLRYYAPASPPPVPTVNQAVYGAAKPVSVAPITPDQSPESTMSIDERLGGQLLLREYGQGSAPPPPYQSQSSHSRNVSEADPVSAVSERSTSPLVGLPTSPKPGVTRFPTLPQSPKPGQSFSRHNGPSAVRAGGALPLRAYDPPMTSPSQSSFQTKQTTFERNGPMSGGGMQTPFTASAVPYSPYQPQTPMLPMSPTLITKADRKRMRRMEPKTPTVELVKGAEDIW